MVADKILVDVIMSEDFVVSLKEDESKLMDFVSLWGNALYHYGIGIENGLKGVRDPPSKSVKDYLDEFLNDESE